MAVSYDGKRIVTGGDDAVVRTWDYETGDVISEALAHSAPVVAVAFSPNGKFLVSTGEEAAIMAWQLD